METLCHLIGCAVLFTGAIALCMAIVLGLIDYIYRRGSTAFLFFMFMRQRQRIKTAYQEGLWEAARLLETTDASRSELAKILRGKKPDWSGS